MEFILKIKLGNAAMQDGTDLARALRHAADVLDIRTHEGLKNCESKIFDANGNTVGAWRIKP